MSTVSRVMPHKLKYKKSMGDRFKVLMLYYNKEMTISAVSNELGINYQTVNDYIRNWEIDRYGLTRDELRWALRNYDQFVG